MSDTEKTLKDLFLLACEAGDEARVRAAITLGVNVNVVGSDTDTGLINAIDEGHEIIMNILLEQPGIDINTVNSTGTFAFNLACGRGRVWAIAALARMPGLQGLNKQAASGRTPLGLAVTEGHLNCVRELLKLPGLDINAKDKNGKTAVMHAAESGKVNIMKELLSVPSIDITIKTAGGKTAEQLARDKSHKNILALLPGTSEYMQAEYTQSEVASLKEAVRNMQTGKGRVSVPECPICFTGMGPPTRIFQCGNGHFVCETCRPGVQACPKCRQPMIGRAHDTEELLRESLQTGGQ